MKCFRHGSEDYVDCNQMPRWSVERPEGSEPRHVCTRHLAWVIAYMTTPTRSVVVTQLGSP